MVLPGAAAGVCGHHPVAAGFADQPDIAGHLSPSRGAVGAARGRSSATAVCSLPSHTASR